MRGANLIMRKCLTTCSKCGVRVIKKKKKKDNCVEPDFHAMKRQYQKGALQAGHQLSHSQILPASPHYVSPFSPLPS